nr:hypothetical protein [uncultured Campylobacter sp.]
MDSVLRQSGRAMSGDRFSCKWLATYGLSRGGRTASDSGTYGT